MPSHDALDFDRSVRDIARALIGVVLLVDGIGGRIVETEVYDQDEPASHGMRIPAQPDPVRRFRDQRALES